MHYKQRGIKMIGDIPVLVLMKKPIVVGGNISVYDVAKLMVKENIHSVLVLTHKLNYEKIEVATDRDIINKVLIKKLHPGKIKVEDISSDKLITISSNTTIDEALKIMSKHKTNELYIVDEEGKIIGLISDEDIIHITPEIISTLRELVDYLLKIINEVTNENIPKIKNNSQINNKKCKNVKKIVSFK
ncbi:Inosine monophosphate dehydrogenase [Methanocaldococcus lauensis]|nr:Inosine monophosphate dehydrogenase [Methanocaldococcus lauensis]